jgi:hypothetical protein
MKRLKLFVALGIVCATTNAQEASRESVEDVLRKGEIVASNIQTAITTHLTFDSTFKVSKQLPEDPQPIPKILVKKDGSFEFDRTPGQHARSLMEEIRQGIHVLQSSDKPRGLDVVALAGGREYWPKLRDISCHESPGIRYFDLDGFTRFCPD